MQGRIERINPIVKILYVLLKNGKYVIVHDEDHSNGFHINLPKCKVCFFCHPLVALLPQTQRLGGWQPGRIFSVVTPQLRNMNPHVSDKQQVAVFLFSCPWLFVSDGCLPQLLVCFICF